MPPSTVPAALTAQDLLTSMRERVAQFREDAAMHRERKERAADGPYDAWAEHRRFEAVNDAKADELSQWCMAWACVVEPTERTA